MYKLLISDFYNTLVNDEEAISFNTMLGIDNIRKSGKLFSIMTSEMSRKIIEYNRDFPFIDYVIGFNGNSIYDVEAEKEIYSKKIPTSVVMKLYNLYSNENICFFTFENCNYYGLNHPKDYAKRIDDLDEFIKHHKNDIYKVTIYFNTRLYAEEELNNIKKIKANLDCYIKEEDNKYVIEITSSVSNKLIGLEKILKKEKIKLDEVAAIASTENAKSLCEDVGLSFYIEKDYIIKNNEEKIKINGENAIEVILQNIN